MTRYSLLALGLLLLKTLLIRPLLAVHSDRVLAGTFEGGSTTHYYYIGVEAVLFVVLLLLMVSAIRGLIPPTATVDGVSTANVGSSED